VLQKRTRNTAALGTSPALAGKWRHALEGMGVPLEDNQRFRVSPTSFYLQSQRSQKAASPPPPHTRQLLHSRQDWGHLDVKLLGAPREPQPPGKGVSGLWESFQAPTVAKSRAGRRRAGGTSLPKGLSLSEDTRPVGARDAGQR